jgi:hypothetical protein
MIGLAGLRQVVFSKTGIIKHSEWQRLQINAAMMRAADAG